MTGFYVVAVITVLILTAYLVTALINPERF